MEAFEEQVEHRADPGALGDRFQRRVAVLGEGRARDLDDPGSVGLRVAALGHAGPRGSLGEEESRLLVKHAVEVGINFFDTANMYSQGSSEEILGSALRDFADRDDVEIATKLRGLGSD